MSRPPSWLVCLAVTTGTLYACRSSTLRPPTEQQARQITSAVQAFIASRAGGTSSLPLLDVERGVLRNVQIEEIGRATTLRRRAFRVSATGVDEDGTALNVAFFVIQSGPIFVVDTAVVSSDRAFGFAP